MFLCFQSVAFVWGFEKYNCTMFKSLLLSSLIKASSRFLPSNDSYFLAL